jgi:uncharacterized protein (DUF1800 family)
MPLYEAQAPTGYSDAADAWVTAGALVARMNFALAFTAGRVPGVRAATPEWPRVRSTTRVTDDEEETSRMTTGAMSGAALDRVVDQLLQGEASTTTRATVARAGSIEQMMALALGSPEFQKR